MSFDDADFDDLLLAFELLLLELRLLLLLTLLERPDVDRDETFPVISIIPPRPPANIKAPPQADDGGKANAGDDVISEFHD